MIDFKSIRIHFTSSSNGTALNNLMEYLVNKLIELFEAAWKYSQK